MRKRKNRNNASARRRKKRYDPIEVQQKQDQIAAEAPKNEAPSFTCTSCGRPAELVDGLHIYPNRPDLAELNFWICEPCDSRVGTHKGTTDPVGAMANKLDRQARMVAHKWFDLLYRAPWAGRDDQLYSKNQAYQWLAEAFDSEDIDGFGIGYLNAKQCQQLEDLISAELCTKSIFTTKEDYEDYLF